MSAQFEEKPAAALLPLSRTGHAAHCLRCLSGLPGSQAEIDASRLVLVFYCIGSLDLLNLLEEKTTEMDRESWREWIWKQQTKVRQGSGFGPGPFMTPFERRQDRVHADHDTPHLIMSYASLLILSILRDDFSRLDRPGLLRFISSCQRNDGSFSIVPGSDECDLRTVYCAFAISHMLDNWSAIDVDRAIGFIASCRSREGGYGQAPFCEAHGGTTYTAVASLHLASERASFQLNSNERDATICWLLHNQDTSGGFGGRTGKDADACYCFWCGAALHILDAQSLVDSTQLASFLSKCQFRYGGIGKCPDELPDPYHTYLSLCALSLYPPILEPSYSLKPLDPLLSCAKDTALWARDFIPSKGENS